MRPLATRQSCRRLAQYSGPSQIWSVDHDEAKSAASAGVERKSVRASLRFIAYRLAHHRRPVVRTSPGSYSAVTTKKSSRRLRSGGMLTCTYVKPRAFQIV